MLLVSFACPWISFQLERNNIDAGTCSVVKGTLRSLVASQRPGLPAALLPVRWQRSAVSQVCGWAAAGVRRLVALL
jgi:hypothetical protein